jgi:hypothetical protein
MTSCKQEYYKPEGIIDQTATFVAQKKQWTSLKNKERVDGYTRIGDAIFGGEISCNVKPLKDIDVETFQVLPGTKYAKDKNHVYYPIAIICRDYSDCGVCYYSDIIVPDAAVDTFRYLGNEYATDGKNVYFRGELTKSTLEELTEKNDL